MVSPQKGTTDRATHLPEIDATSEVPGKSTDKVASIHGLFHEGVLDGGFCHLQDVELDWDVECGSYLNVSSMSRFYSSFRIFCKYDSTQRR
uniref:Uncharacterized protein n=1 Tax=Magallana gigas TaxID=29159 RepID=K1Q5F2_MAGGI